MRLNHIFYLLVVLLLVLCGLLLFYAGSDTKLFYCVEALVGLALVFGSADFSGGRERVSRV